MLMISNSLVKSICRLVVFNRLKTISIQRNLNSITFIKTNNLNLNSSRMKQASLM